MAGAHVVATNAEGGGPRDILGYAQSGQLVPRGDPKALAQALLASLDKPKDALETAAVRNRLEARFGFAAAVKGHAEFLRALLAQN